MTTPAVTHHLGLDLGGTNVKRAVMARVGPAWQVVFKDQAATRIVATPVDVPDSVIAQLIELAADAETRFGPLLSIGVGVPGLYDPATGVTRFLVNVPGPWAGRPVAVPIAAAAGRPTTLINDARAFGLAELRLGAAQGARTMVGLTLGTGVGGVVAIDGQIHLGHDGTAGELGHQTLEPDGPMCNCGNRGCLEAFVRADRLAEACGAESVEVAVERARSGDAQAIGGFARAGHYLGLGLANAVTVMTPDVIVLGGGLAAASDLFLDAIWAELRTRVRTTSLDELRVVTAGLGTWAGAIGAAIHGAESTTWPVT